MDAAQLDRISMSLRTRTRRRSVLMGLAGATLATLGFTRPSGVDAKNKAYECCAPRFICHRVEGSSQEIKDYETSLAEFGLTCTKIKEKVTE